MSDTGSKDPYDPNRPGQPADQPQWGSTPPAPAQPGQYGQPGGEQWTGAQPYGQQQYGQPQYGQPQYGQPQYGQPAPYGAVGVGAEVPYASWIQRVASFLVDGILPVIPLVVVVMTAAAIGGEDGSAASGLIVLLAYVAYFGFVIWNSCFRQGRTGQSIGKSLIGTYLIKERDGQYTGAGLAFARQIAHIVDSLPCYIGYLWPLWDTKRQTFADKICSTVVVTRR